MIDHDYVGIKSSHFGSKSFPRSVQSIAGNRCVHIVKPLMFKSLIQQLGHYVGPSNTIVADLSAKGCGAPKEGEPDPARRLRLFDFVAAKAQRVYFDPTHA